MAILIDNDKNIFTLHTDNSTYQMQVDKYGFLLHLYYGRKTKGTMDYLLTYADRDFPGIHTTSARIGLIPWMHSPRNFLVREMEISEAPLFQ